MLFDGKKILIVCPHPDDESFGMGGTINKLNLDKVTLVTFSDCLNYPNNDGIVDEWEIATKLLGIKNKKLLGFENMNFPQQGTQIRSALFNIKKDLNPDIVFSTNPKSINPDHAELGNSVKAVFQDSTILFYEVLRGDYEHLPELYIQLNQDDVDLKLNAIKTYKSQWHRTYSNLKSIEGFLRMRGAQMNSDYAESFEIYRMLEKLK